MITMTGMKMITILTRGFKYPLKYFEVSFKASIEAACYTAALHAVYKSDVHLIRICVKHVSVFNCFYKENFHKETSDYFFFL